METLSKIWTAIGAGWAFTLGLVEEHALLALIGFIAIEMFTVWAMWG